MLYDIIKKSANCFGDHVAIVYDGKEFSYRELLHMTDALATSLQELGLQKGDRLALYLYNCPEIIFCYFACFKLGVTVVPINYRLKKDEARYIIGHSQPNILISQQRLFSEIAGILPELHSLKLCYLLDPAERLNGTLPFSTLLDLSKNVISPAVIPGDTAAVILYTSGTTGKPKGSVLAHDQMMNHTRGHCELVRYQECDRTLVCLALTNNFAFSHQMLSALHAGATLVITQTFDPVEVLEKIEHENITMLYMMPVMFHALNKQAESKGRLIPNRLRLAIVAGDTTPKVVFDRFKQNFNLEMCEGIGMTETQIYTLNPLGAGKKFGSVGLPVGYTEVSVQDDTGIPSPTGEIGEIAVRGEIVMRSYLNSPEANTASFRGGWFLTGDLGYFDEDGYLWFRGRRKQLIVHDGHNISPQEVEEVFYHHPAVFEVGVIGVPDTFEGENLHAFIALKSDTPAIGADELLAFAKEHIADYKLPDTITFIDALPKGSTGKINRKLLQEYKRSR